MGLLKNKLQELEDSGVIVWSEKHRLYVLTNGDPDEPFSLHEYTLSRGINFPPVIGVAGPARVGKDTVSDYLVVNLPGYNKVSFADPLKNMLMTGLGFTWEQLYGDEKADTDERYGCTPRHAMQTLGTEWGRNLIHPDVWLKALKIQVQGRHSILADVRFPNEADFARRKGVLIHVEGRGGITGDHQSEQSLEKLPEDYVIRNDGTLEFLEEQVLEVTSKIRCKYQTKGS